MQRELQEAGEAGFKFVGVTVSKTRFGGREVVSILLKEVRRSARATRPLAASLQQADATADNGPVDMISGGEPDPRPADRPPTPDSWHSLHCAPLPGWGSTGNDPTTRQSIGSIASPQCLWKSPHARPKSAPGVSGIGSGDGYLRGAKVWRTQMTVLSQAHLRLLCKTHSAATDLTPPPTPLLSNR